MGPSEAAKHVAMDAANEASAAGLDDHEQLMAGLDAAYAVDRTGIAASGKVCVYLTELEARMLFLVADNGWADGDFGDTLTDSQERRATMRAIDKLRAARRATP